MSITDSIVIVGGGHAGAQLCVALVAAGWGPKVHLVCEEPDLPYQRPPLSKTYLKNRDEAIQLHRATEWFGEAGIRVHRGDPARSIDRSHRRVTLASGVTLDYRSLVLATGTRARQLPDLPTGLRNVAILRTAADAARLRQQMPDMHKLTVIGGGFIGLEVAATARAAGKQVEVIEAAPRLLMRSCSVELAEHVLRAHRDNGVNVRVGAAVGGFEVEGDVLSSVIVDGARTSVDTVLLGVGAVPEIELAKGAGLDFADGILVDDYMQTSDRAVLAIGDCASFIEPSSGRRRRLESVQNAADQAKCAAATLTGSPSAHRAIPWFWSEQGSLRLQMAGLLPVQGTAYRRQGANPASFSLLHYAGERLVCVESVNAPADHIAARRLLELGRHPDPTVAADPSRALRSFQ